MALKAPFFPLDPNRTSVIRLLFYVVLTALVLRLAIVPFNRYLFEDLMDANHIHAWEPGNVAESLITGHGFGSPFVSNQPSAIMSPVYPLVVAALFKIFGIHTAAAIFAAHALDCFIGALSSIPLFLITRRSFSERVARWAAWGWAFAPYGIYFAAAWAWSTQILIFCLLWLFYLAQRMERSARFVLWAGFGLLAGFAGLTEPSILVVIPFLALLACFRLRFEHKRWLAPGLVAALALTATLSPWFIRNAIVFHRFIPMRDSMGLELWMGNNGYSTRWTSDQLHPLHDADELADYNRMGEIAYMAHKSLQAHAYIGQHPARFAWMSARRAIYLWTGFWSFYHDYLAMEPTDPANIPFATSLTLLTLIGLTLLFRRNRFEAIRYGGVLFLFPVMYYFSHPEPYHMRVLDPLMVILCSYAFLAWRERVAATAVLPVPKPVIVLPEI